MKQRFSPLERLLTFTTILRPGEGQFIWRLVLNSFLLLFSLYLLKVIRVTILLADGNPIDKSVATAISAGVILLLLPFYSLAYQKLQNYKERSVITQIVNLFFASSILVFLVLSIFGNLYPYVFYVWHSVYGVVVVSQFWSFCADLMNRRSGKRIFPVVMIGASLGAWQGSYLADLIYKQFGILGAFSIALACLLIATQLAKSACHRIPPEAKVIGNNNDNTDLGASPFKAFINGLGIVTKSKYLIYIATFVVLMNWVNTTGEFVFDSFVMEAANQALLINPQLIQEELLSDYYSSYYSWISLIGFLIQTFLVSKLFRFFGIKSCVSILPIVMIIGYGLIAFIPIFAIVRLSRISENSVSYSLANTVRQALYLPLKRHEKYVGKTVIESFFWRIGDVIQGLVIFYGINFLAWTRVEFIWLCLTLSVVMFMLAKAIGHSYTRTLNKKKDDIKHAPVLNNPVKTYQLHAGWKEEVKIPEDVFYDPDPGDALKFKLIPCEPEKMYPWIKFDRKSLLITFEPPENETGSISLKLVATDIDNLSCDTTLHVEWS